ncbi:GNAT family N-acetyltransferase, partial [Enterobacter hormaechei]|nr:GNAT family N-acetyltransferase [Enterobacter hormaechei]
YSSRCPYTDYYVNGMLRVLAQEKSIPLKVIKLETREQAQSSPTPATIFSLFYNGKFVTTDLSVCTESKFIKLVK